MQKIFTIDNYFFIIIKITALNQIFWAFKSDKNIVAELSLATHRPPHPPHTTAQSSMRMFCFVFFSKHKPHLDIEGFISEGALPALGETREELP